MSVRITGPVLSALLYEHSSADNDVEGLLLGTVTDVIKDTISDTSISNIQRQTMYSVFSFIPCSMTSRWYDNKMTIKDENLRKLMQGHSLNELIGWFKLRRNSSLSVSMKERSISRRLLKWLRESGEYSRHDLLFKLCVSHFSHQTALFICDHQFMVYNERGSFVAIPETITNLAETARACYSSPIGPVTSKSCSYNRVLSKSKSTFVDENGESAIVGEVRHLNKKMQAKLKNLSANVEDSEQQLAKELAEVILLRQKVAASRDAIDTTMNALHISDAHSTSDKMPRINNNLAETANVSDVELMSNDENELELTEGWNTHSSHDAVNLLDLNFEEPEHVSCLQPIPVLATSLGFASAAGDKNLEESSDLSLCNTSQKSAVDSDFSGHVSTSQYQSANSLESKPPTTKNESFGFVSDMMSNFTSPVKKPNKGARNVSVASNSQPFSTVLNTTSAYATTFDSDEECV